MPYIPLRVTIKNTIKRIFPAFLFSFVVYLWRKTLSKTFDFTKTQEKYTNIFLQTHGFNVVGGPFKGMKYIDEAAGSSYLLKLIGVYEEILHPQIEKIKTDNYSTIIDIGCAEGYYLIGLGMNKPTTKLVGYDIDLNALALVQKLYDKNNLTNPLVLESNCTPLSLDSYIDDDTLLICDAEGFEKEILNPSTSPKLATVKTFIVELHDFFVPGAKQALLERFLLTHTTHIVHFKNGNPDAYPFFATIHNKEDVYTLLRERGEQDQEWLIMERK